MSNEMVQSRPMIQEIHYQNFKVLRDARLPLGRFTLIVGPNGSGKSAALQALPLIIKSPGSLGGSASIGAPSDRVVQVEVHWADPHQGLITRAVQRPQEHPDVQTLADGEAADSDVRRTLERALSQMAIYSLDPSAIAQVSEVKREATLQENGGELAAVLDQLWKRHRDRFEALEAELGRWYGEFDRISFDTPGGGKVGLGLQTRTGGHHIPAAELSQGTLLGLAMLTVAYLPDPPPIVCFEEPNHGIHPRLVRRIQDALYRLSHPESAGETRDPVQVIATTHSPYLLDLYRDHPEEVVIAHRREDGATFDRLADLPNIEEILGEGPLGEIWYTGILGGVPAAS